MEPLDGERTVSAVASTKKPRLSTRGKALLIAVLTFSVIAFVFWKNPGHKKDEDVVRPPPTGVSQHVAYEPPPLPPAMPAASSNPPFAPKPQPQPQPSTLPAPMPLPAAVQSAVGTPQSTKPGPRMLSFAAEPTRTDAAPSQQTSGSGTEPATHVTYKSSPIVGGRAGAAMDADLVLMPGIIRCVLDTAIDSTLPGPLMCHLPAPVISDGGVVLMEKGTNVIGSYSNEIHQGQGRLMAVSATAWTPNHVPVPLGGSFADSLGRNGLDGDVDNHLWSRFGGAVMLSLADSALGIIQASVSKGGNSYVSLSSGGGVGSLAQQVLQSTINQPPTISKPQGSEVSIWVLAPIDFSAAYHLGTNK